MKVQLLPSTFNSGGRASDKQHLTCFVIDDCVALDAGSLAMAASEDHQRKVRDIVLTHAHLDHVAGLPLFIDDLFPTLSSPVTVHSTQPVIDTLERDIFNWSVYPRFSELTNDNGPVLAYSTYKSGDTFQVKHLTFQSIEVNHKVPSTGFLISDESSTIAVSGDTAEMDGFWDAVNNAPNLSAVLIECAFPNELEELARLSHHLTPKKLKGELEKCKRDECLFYVVNLKPMHRQVVLDQLAELNIESLEAIEVGKVYEW